MMTGYDILKSLYDISDTPHFLDELQNGYIKTILTHSESHKGVLTVLITSLVKKVEMPSQDIRLHKEEFEGGYSGRGYDTKFITPFMRNYFPRFAMAESGWLTRSLEQPHPFMRDFAGKIRNRSVKTAFLEIIHDVQVNLVNPKAYLISLLNGLKQLQDFSVDIPSTTTSQFTVSSILGLLESHFLYTYKTSGASRLPVLALYAVYQSLMLLPRYEKKVLVPLKNQTTADTKSHSIGDIEITNPDGQFFEAIEVNHEKLIDLDMVQIAFEKIKKLPISRYYLLTTKTPNTNQLAEIEEFCSKILSQHGCEMIVNGLMPTLKYYLRLLPSLSQFLDDYTAILQTEFSTGGIKSVHLQKWLSLISENHP